MHRVHMNVHVAFNLHAPRKIQSKAGDKPCLGAADRTGSYTTHTHELMQDMGPLSLAHSLSTFGELDGLVPSHP